jgi:hypothetical protein
MPRIRVITENPVNIKADALIVPVLLHGPWDSPLDRAIRELAGDHFHEQLARAQTGYKPVVARGLDGPRARAFHDVIFVPVLLNGEGNSPKHIRHALEAASKAGCKEVTVAATLWLENRLNEGADELGDGLHLFRQGNRYTPVKRINFAVATVSMSVALELTVLH